MGESVEVRCEDSIERIHQDLYSVLQLILEESLGIVALFVRLLESGLVSISAIH